MEGHKIIQTYSDNEIQIPTSFDMVIDINNEEVFSNAEQEELYSNNKVFGSWPEESLFVLIPKQQGNLLYRNMIRVGNFSNSMISNLKSDFKIYGFYRAEENTGAPVIDIQNDEFFILIYSIIIDGQIKYKIGIFKKIIIQERDRDIPSGNFEYDLVFESNSLRNVRDLENTTLRLNSESELVNNINSVLDSNYDSLTISNISAEISGTILLGPYEEIVNYTNDVEGESSGPSMHLHQHKHQ